MNTRAKRFCASAFGLFALTAVLATPVRVAALSGPITDDNVAEHIAAAKTGADHEALASFYAAEAKQAAGKAAQHEAMLKSYSSGGGRSFESMRSHCSTLVSSYKAEQKELERLAAAHAKMAKEVK